MAYLWEELLFLLSKESRPVIEKIFGLVFSQLFFKYILKCFLKNVFVFNRFCFDLQPCAK